MIKVCFLGLVTAITFSDPASAQTAKAVAVAACGTPPSTFSAGVPHQPTMDTNGKLCTESTCGVSPPVTYSAGLRFPILIDTNGRICTN